MYYPDLSPYTYHGDPEPESVNIGWLDSAHPFPQGPVPPGLVERLIELSLHPAKQHRGLHDCEFCPPGQGRHVFARSSAGQELRLGSAELRVRSHGSHVYAVPTLISHYIAGHGYQPPAEFIDAVLHPPAA